MDKNNDWNRSTKLTDQPQLDASPTGQTTQGQYAYGTEMDPRGPKDPRYDCGAYLPLFTNAFEIAKFIEVIADNWNKTYVDQQIEVNVCVRKQHEQ